MKPVSIKIKLFQNFTLICCKFPIAYIPEHIHALTPSLMSSNGPYLESKSVLSGEWCRGS